MLLRLIDFLKVNGVTIILTNLISGDTLSEVSEVGISSIMDTLIVLRDIEYANDRTRVLFVLKSRGMAHSRQFREVLFTDKGIDLGPAPNDKLSQAAGSVSNR